jgi:hypothetical protein
MKKGKLAIFALIIGVILIIISPFLLTRNLGWIIFDDKTGSIGDTIGGITSPISSLLGAFLVYLALNAQIKANKIIQKQFRKQQQDANYEKALANAMEQIKFIRGDINQWTVVGKYEIMREIGRYEISTFQGVEAIGYILEHHHKNINEFEKSNLKGHLMQIESLLDRMLETVSLIHNKQFCKDDHDYLINTLKGVYMRILPYLYVNRNSLLVK